MEEKIRAGPMICFDSEPELDRIMSGDFSSFHRDDCELRFNEVFRWAWESWRLAVGVEIGTLYPIAVEIMNIGARNGGKSDFYIFI